ncbi:IS200/IS605 family element RNA-guided endonuclease TnpB [Anaerocellum danielii]|uniref:IS200/IS605 family element RNA-guided endonuclease TnpB n=1 Tax=Anaerocellum danielii TaxID=1387557 RepID=A0ABZ0U202_9FIRM|nr:IS200/IS605 family element RNA-guided endonuclease TnpB [Caldicellulosiruptor danielii]WPX08474.1 IS200/IS605 family element RNA-guided endonuclease TnpB [Caldicellulosiruptor danielii]
MIVTYRYRIYPTKEQERKLKKTFGCVRFVWNYFLARQNEIYKTQKVSPNTYEWIRHLQKHLKKEYPWLKEVDKFALENQIKRLVEAFEKFFNKQAKYPKFKRKKSNYFSYTTNFTNGNIEIDFGELATDPKKKRCWGRIKLPKLGWVKARIHRIFEGKIKTATVKLLPNGYFYVSIAVEQDVVDNPNMPKTPANFAIAFDLGVKEFVVDSNGRHIENPKILSKYEKRIKKLQRELSRKKVGSRNFEKTRLKLAKLYEKVANIRLDYLHKLSSQIVHENQVIICEDLKTKNLVRNHNFAKSILDVSWSKFVEMLEYKSEWYGRTFMRVPSNFPSSQICSNCGYRNEQVKDLKIRVWQCPVCGMVHDREENAAKNLLKEGLSRLGITISV